MINMSTNTYRFDPVDMQQLRLTAQVPPGRRIKALLDAYELATGLRRGRLRQIYPHLSPREINLKLIEEFSRAERTPYRP